jgi:hypothetical protein
MKSLLPTAALAVLAAWPAAAQTSLEILDVEGKVIARLQRPLASGRKGALRLQRASGCDFTVQARFDDEGEVDETLNLCREKVLRFSGE